MAPGSLRCHICNREDFDSNLSLSRHYCDDHSAFLWCPFCCHQYATVQQRDEHVNKNHISPASFPCRLCVVKSRTKKDVGHHNRECHPAQLAELTCGNCSIVFPNKNCLNLHTQYCQKIRPPLLTPPPSSNQQQSKESNSKEPRVRRQSTSDCRSSNRPSNATTSKPSSAAAVTYDCQYCGQSFTNRTVHCRHLIAEHQAGVVCSYCDKQMIAPLGDEIAALRVFKEHLEEDHQGPGRWRCVYCTKEFSDRTHLRQHQKGANHRIIACNICRAVVPSHQICRLHKDFQHPVDQRQTNKEAGRQKTTPSGLEGMCLCCFQRHSLNDIRQHLLYHVEQERALISCNECFEFIGHPIVLDKHKPCFELEAQRFRDYVTGDKRVFALCYCGYCARDQEHLSRHQGWCHKESQCPFCKETAFGYAGMQQHMCKAPVQAASQRPETPLSAVPKQLKQSPESPQRIRSQSLNEGAVVRSPQPPLPVTTNGIADHGSMELPDSPEEIVVKEEEPEIDTAVVASTAKVAVQPSRQRKDSTSSSSSTSSSDVEMGPAIPSSPKKLPVQQRGVQKASTSRPQIQQAVFAASSSVGSSDSEEQPRRAVKPKHPPSAAPTEAMRRMWMAAQNGVDDSSSTSESDSDGEPPPKRPNRGLLPAPALAEVEPTRPRVAAVFSVSDTMAAGKRRATSTATLKVPTPRQDSVSATAQRRHLENGVQNRKNVGERPIGADLEFVCALCNMSSSYKQNVIRHIEGIHRILVDKCPDFCIARERPRPPEILDEEHDENVRNARSVGAAAKKTCPNCEALIKRIQAMEKILAKSWDQTDKMRRKWREIQDDFMI